MLSIGGKGNITPQSYVNNLPICKRYTVLGNKIHDLSHSDMRNITSKCAIENGQTRIALNNKKPLWPSAGRHTNWITICPEAKMIGGTVQVEGCLGKCPHWEMSKRFTGDVQGKRCGWNVPGELSGRGWRNVWEVNCPGGIIYGFPHRTKTLHM